LGTTTFSLKRTGEKEMEVPCSLRKVRGVTVNFVRGRGRSAGNCCSVRRKLCRFGYKNAMAWSCETSTTSPAHSLVALRCLARGSNRRGRGGPWFRIDVIEGLRPSKSPNHSVIRREGKGGEGRSKCPENNARWSKLKPPSPSNSSRRPEGSLCTRR